MEDNRKEIIQQSAKDYWAQQMDTPTLRESHITMFEAGAEWKEKQYDTLAKERELLIEALENILDRITKYMPQVNTGNEKQVAVYLEYHKAKELLNNLQIKTT